MASGEVIEATCSALLFLSRGTPSGGYGALTRPMDDTDINLGAASRLLPADFEDFLDLVLSRWRKASDAAVKQRLFAKATAVGPRIVGPLLQRLSSTKDDERSAAFALLRHATGLDHGHDPAAAPVARDEAVARWKAWLLANEPQLAFDAVSGRIAAK